MIQKLNFLKLKILTLFLSIGIWLLGYTYFIAYNGSFNNSLFWASMIIIGLTIFLIIIDEDVSKKYKLIYIFIFGAIIYILNILPSPIHFNFYDELATYETTKLIYENGNLNIITHFEMPKYYPGLGLLTVIFKNIINLDIFTTARILIGSIHSFVLIFLYLFLKDVLKDVGNSGRTAAIGTFIYATNPLYIYFHSLFSYESVGIFFGICLLYLTSKISFGGKSVSYSISIMIIMFALTISHHLSSLLVLLFMILLMIAIRFRIRYTQSFLQIFHTNITFLTFISIFMWMTYVATVAISYLYGHFIDRFRKIFELSLFGGSSTTIISPSLNKAMLPNYELIIDNQIYAPLLILLSIIGIIIVINKYENKNSYLYVLIIFGPILYILSLGFILTSGQELAIRTWGFLYIGVSLMTAIAINRLIGLDNLAQKLTKKLAKIFSLSAIILIIMGGISIGDKPIHRVPNNLSSPKLLGASGSMTTDVFRSAEWFEKNFGKYNKISTDMGISSIFAYYGDQNPYSSVSWKIFFPDRMDKNISNFIKYYEIKYIIVDRRITQSLAEYGVYFGKKERDSEYKLMEYGRKQPLSIKSIEKFDTDKIIYKIYDNGNIGIYNILKKKEN